MEIGYLLPDHPLTRNENQLKLGFKYESSESHITKEIYLIAEHSKYGINNELTKKLIKTLWG